MTTISLEEIEDTARLLDGVAIYTPMDGARWLSDRCGGEVRLKCENLQRTGSFKMRGAYTRIARLSDAEKAAGVVAASAGNHAQGVALSAKLLGVRATVFMPEGAPIPKINATMGYGADVVFHGQYLHHAMEAAQAFSAETGAVFLHPYDHRDVVMGQATCGLEILAQSPGVRTVLVPTGGGGLLSGIAIAIKQQRPDVRIIGVQAKNAAAYPPSLRAGHPVRLEKMSTMADGIAVGVPGDINFAAIKELVDDVITVTEESMARALLTVAERAKYVVEPSGAAAVAAMMDNPDAFETPAVAVLSGGNVDPLLLGKVIQRGMAAAGRFLYLRVVISDLPGGLAGLLTDIGSAGASVIEVAHERISEHLNLNEVEVSLQLETRGPKHAEQVQAMLADKGYRVDL